jgi:hypothetical protein
MYNQILTFMRVYKPQIRKKSGPFGSVFLLPLMIVLFLTAGKTTEIRAAAPGGLRLFAEEAPAEDKPATLDEKEQAPSSIFETKSLFEEAGVIEKDGDQLLKAPPDFGGGGNPYNPGGQVGPKLPLDDSFAPWGAMLLAYLLYVIVRFSNVGKRCRNAAN